MLEKHGNITDIAHPKWLKCHQEADSSNSVVETPTLFEACTMKVDKQGTLNRVQFTSAVVMAI